jgi:uncharacterized protein YndB with AHSA1/START domain
MTRIYEESSMTRSLEIQWPDRYRPGNSPIHVKNELDIAAMQEHVWAWLTHATLWPSWYVNSTNVTILEDTAPNLQMGTRFRWKTFGVTITSTVLEFVPGERIAWDAHAIGVDAYHAWILQPSAQGCHVLTEETQHGWVARLGKLFMPNRMHKFHQLWLAELETRARAGLPLNAAGVPLTG